MDGVFVGSGIFKSSNPEARAKAIVQATTHYKDAKILASNVGRQIEFCWHQLLRHASLPSFPDWNITRHLPSILDYSRLNY